MTWWIGVAAGLLLVASGVAVVVYSRRFPRRARPLPRGRLFVPAPPEPSNTGVRLLVDGVVAIALGLLLTAVCLALAATLA